MRNGVKRPAKLAGANVVGANISRRRGQSFRIAAADDDQILVNNSGTGKRRPLQGGRAAQIFAKIDSAIFAEVQNGLAGGGVERVERIHHAYEDAPVLAARPKSEPAIGLRSLYPGIEFPEQFAGCRVQREYFLSGRDSVKHAAHFDGARLQATGFTCVKFPRDRELAHVAPVDL